VDHASDSGPGFALDFDRNYAAVARAIHLPPAFVPLSFGILFGLRTLILDSQVLLRLFSPSNHKAAAK
jgi:hypothetical protein